MSFATGFSEPFFLGAQTTLEDDRFDVIVGGTGYAVDWEMGDRFRLSSVALLRASQDAGQETGEAALNPEAGWRRSVETWHHGAGQRWQDKPDSDRSRFFSSRGVDPWRRHELSLLPDTVLSQAAGRENVFLTTTGAALYASDAGVLRRTDDLTTWLACSGLPGQDITSVSSDGSTVYVGTTIGTYSGKGTFTQLAPGRVDVVRHLKGRLMVAAGASIYNIVGPGALPASLVTIPVDGWQWVDFAEGKGFIYAAGRAGDKSAIYRIGVREDGTGLEVPVLSGKLPDGELVRSLTSYLGFLVVGTDRGLRLASTDPSGEVTPGALVETGRPVLCAEGQGRFVWFGWPAYDAEVTGLGRVDLTEFVATLSPAYASDLMAPGQGLVTSVATFSGRRVFAVAGSGVWVETTARVPAGQVVQGRHTFGLLEQKTFAAVNVRHAPLPEGGRVTVRLAVDDQVAATVAVSSDAGSAGPVRSFPVYLSPGSWGQLTVRLEGAAVVNRVTVLAEPSAERTEEMYAPLLLRDLVILGNGDEYGQDPGVLWQQIRRWRDDRTVLTVSMGGMSFRGVVDDTEFWPFHRSSHGPFPQGTAVVKLKGSG